MKRNVIVLTAGISGSSVLTGLIAGAGFWPGDSTYKKSDYDTFENERLVQLNKTLLAAADYRGDYTVEFAPEVITRVAALYGKIDPAPYRQFLAQCEARSPWVWKDPRLWLTIRFWKHFLDMSRCRFVLLERDMFQTWVSVNLRRQVQTYGYLKRYNDGVNRSIERFLIEAGQPYLSLVYEELIRRPEAPLARLNEFLETRLTVADLQRVYHKPLRRSPRSWTDYPKAALIYLKNYRRRYR